MALDQEADRGNCGNCGQRIEQWRQEHSQLCSECGMARCRTCGQIVEQMEHTMNGGECQACRPRA